MLSTAALCRASFGVAAKRAACARFCSSHPQIDATRLSIERTLSPKEKTPTDQLVFGKVFTDHMLEVDWTARDGWGAPRIVPYHALQLDPACSSLHYGLECFEGMKAYVDDEDRIRLFRPDLNMRRMNDSMNRLSLPTFDGDELVKCIGELCKVDKDWIPRAEGYSLYLRPTGISTHPILGVDRALAAKVFVICSPVGPYYPEGFAPVTLYAQREFVRAWPGGTGGSKVGGNYAPTIMPQKIAQSKGFSQVLWLFGDQITEVGTMNMFVYWVNEQGEKELVTAPLDGTILPGVTRQSVLDLARSWKEFEVSERTITITELIKAVNEGRLIESFGCGTAAVVSPIKGIHYEGQDIAIPIKEELQAGELTHRFWDTITSIQCGRTPSEWSRVVE